MHPQPKNIWRGVIVSLLLAIGFGGLMPAQATPLAQTADEYEVFLPVVSRFPDPCAALPGVSYGYVVPEWPPSDRPAHIHADLNLEMRGYEFTLGHHLGLIDVGGPTDVGAPQLHGLFNPPRLPTFVRTARSFNWNWAGPPEPGSKGGPITDPPVTMIWMRTNPSEIVYLPDRVGGNIAAGTSYKALVLYATPYRITITYTARDNIAVGYALHLENICVQPGLLAAYEWANANGRRPLVALAPGQAIGRTYGDQLGVIIRDVGAMMDPRVRKDWWKDY